MSFGFSVSDIIASYKLAFEIYNCCFTKAQGADVKYLQFGREIKSLGISLKQLEEIVVNAEDQRPKRPWHHDDADRVTATALTTLSEVTGDFKRTLRDCEILLSDNSKFQRSAANFVDNVAWHSSTEGDVNTLRQRVHFHMIKVNLIAKPFELQLLLGIRRELQQLRKDVAALRGVLIQDTAESRDPANPKSRDRRSLVPADLASRFTNALAASKPESFQIQDHLPLKEGFDALVFHLASSTVNFKSSPGPGQNVPDEAQYVNLVKSSWIIERLKESIYLQSAGSESLWADYIRELEDEITNQLTRFDTGELEQPSLDVIVRLPDYCFAIWVDEGPLPRPAALAEQRPFEEKILELALPSLYGNRQSTLTVFRKSDIALRLVSTTKDEQNKDFHSEESMDVNMNSTRLVPAFAASQDTSIIDNSVLLCNSQGEETKWHQLQDPSDVAKFQRALTGFRVSHDISNISWYMEFNKFSKTGISGKARLQFWHLKPLPKISPPGDSTTSAGSGSSTGTSPQSPSGSANLRRYWTSGTIKLPGSSIASPVNGSRGDGIALTRPELPVLVIFTMCDRKYTFFHIQMDSSISAEPQTCVNCRNQKRPCSRVLIRSSSKKWNIRRLSAQLEDEKGLASWDLACFRYPEHPGFKDLEELSKIKYMSLHFETLDKRDEFCKEFELLENLRNRDLNDYEGTINERKYLANNIRQH